MKQKLIDELSKFGYPVFLQGSLNTEDEYPETFIAYWTDDVEDNAHYDDSATSYAWDFTVILYSSDVITLDTKKDEIRKALKKAGFIPQEKGMDIPSDEPTHTGWAMSFYFIENEKEGE